MFRSLHMKLMLILLLLITSLMAVVGAFLTTSVSSFYIDTFYQQINEVFGEDNGDFIATLRSSADLPDGAEQIRLLVDTRAGELGIDYRTRNYFVLDGETGAFLAGSTDSSELPREQTANLLTARNAVAQRDGTLVGDESDITASYTAPWWATRAISPPATWMWPSPSWAVTAGLTLVMFWTTRIRCPASTVNCSSSLCRP